MNTRTDLRIVSTFLDNAHWIVGPKSGRVGWPYLPVFGGIPGLTSLATTNEQLAEQELERLQILEDRSLIGGEYA